MPIIGFLHSGSPREYPFVVDAFRQGLKETGYNEGLNVAVEYRWAQDHPDHCPVLVNELVRRVCIAPARGAALQGIRALLGTRPSIERLIRSLRMGLIPMEFPVKARVELAPTALPKNWNG
jgi:putative ABC transport system substrate-binding protein